MNGALARLLRPGSGIRWLWAMGLGVPLLLGVVLVALVLMSLSRGVYTPPTLFEVGMVTDFEPGMPRYFENERIWVVRLPSDGFLALYDVDPTSRCSVPWRPRFEFQGQAGWFHDACRGSVYDLRGQCFDGPCTRGLDRFGVLRQANEVIVDLTSVEEGAAVDPRATPVRLP